VLEPRAENGAEAVAAVEAGQYDVVLMDVQMPVLDGIEASDRIRGLSAPKNKVPIIAVTAHAMVGARERYLAAGMDGYLSKPLDLTALLRVLGDIGQGVRNSEAAETPREMENVSHERSANADLDEGQLRALAKYLHAARIRELLLLFLSQLDEQVADIGALVQASDWPALMREAHTLAGAAGNIGATRVYRIARALEVACGEPKANIISDLIGQLVKARKSIAKAMRRQSAARIADIQQSAA
jgi:CheY-like chemotaxis protein